jgi:adenylosuccinate synthase
MLERGVLSCGWLDQIMSSLARSTCVVGLQWGDEAKGKIVDLLAEDHDFVVRYNGGANAGHTVVWGDRTFKLSILPTGILKPKVKSVIGNGLVILPERLLEEIDQLEKAGIPVGTNLAVSEHAHVIFPYHLEEEKIWESNQGNSIGTTGRGIGPCYQDKIGRVNAIRMGELLDPVHLREKLRVIVPRKNQLLKAFASGPDTLRQFNPDIITDHYLAMASRIKPMITNTTKLLQNGLAAGKKILFEAAQGSLLDVDHGSYPYVTGSHSLPGGIWNGTGISTRKLGRIIGVAKAYSTRVGKGPMPTELFDATGERIRKIGREYGTVTGRPRRIGWFDLMTVKYTSQIADVDEVTLMLLDVLSGIPQLNLCTGYLHQGKPLDTFPADAYQLEGCQPVYEQLPGWAEDVSSCRNLADLPVNARKYIDRVQELLGLRISMISVGPDRDQTIPVQ